MDVILLSRIQFAVNIGFHYLFPPLSIGLSLMIIIIEGIFLRTKDPRHRRIAIFWTRIFGLSFALGVATGLVQLFAFGNNWSHFSRFVGDVFGSALASEGIFAFFLEAGFIGVMLFGWNRLKPKVHFFSTLCVSFGAHFSATWIVAANSWMQTPAGYKIVGEGKEARAVLTSFWEMIFNPSFLDRLAHVLIGCWLTGAFMVLSVSAYYLLKNRHKHFAQFSLKMGLIVGSLMVGLQLISGDGSARKVAEYQPTKLAAMEGIFQTQSRADMSLIGWVDVNKGLVYGIKAPGILSFLLYKDREAVVTGLDQFPKEDWPKVQGVFQSYHLMIYMWGCMVLGIFLGLYLLKKKGQKRKGAYWYLIFCVACPFIANEAGWMTAEMGRQPWVIYNVLRTSAGASSFLSVGQVLGSLTLFIVMYSFLFALFIFLLNRKIQLGPDEEEEKGSAVYTNPYREKGSH